MKKSGKSSLTKLKQNKLLVLLILISFILIYTGISTSNDVLSTMGSILIIVSAVKTAISKA